MKSKTLFLIAVMLIVIKSYSQNSFSEIDTKSGIHYITTDIDYPITGTYLFNGGEPTVVLNGDGIGFYQLHEQPSKAIVWGIECLKTGQPKFIKGFDSAAYTLWYQYTNSDESETSKDWKFVEFTIHFSTLKMYIQGERLKNYSE